MAVVSDPGSLGEIPLFKGLTREQLSRLNELLRRRTFEAGTNIIYVAEPRVTF